MLGRVPRGYIIKSDSSCNEGVDLTEHHGWSSPSRPWSFRGRIGRESQGVVIGKSCLPFRLSVIGRVPRGYTKMLIGS